MTSTAKAIMNYKLQKVQNAYRDRQKGVAVCQATDRQSQEEN